MTDQSPLRLHRMSTRSALQRSPGPVSHSLRTAHERSRKVSESIAIRPFLSTSSLSPLECCLRL